MLISDVSIVVCRAMFNTLSTGQDSWYARTEYDQIQQCRESTEVNPGLSFAVRQGKVNIKV